MVSKLSLINGLMHKGTLLEGGAKRYKRLLSQNPTRGAELLQNLAGTPPYRRFGNLPVLPGK